MLVLSGTNLRFCTARQNCIRLTIITSTNTLATSPRINTFFSPALQSSPTQPAVSTPWPRGQWPMPRGNQCSASLPSTGTSLLLISPREMRALSCPLHPPPLNPDWESDPMSLSRVQFKMHDQLALLMLTVGGLDPRFLLLCHFDPLHFIEAQTIWGARDFVVPESALVCILLPLLLNFHIFFSWINNS